MVFATETLALGINMPAKSVVLERLVKWNGEAHADLSAGATHREGPDAVASTSRATRSSYGPTISIRRSWPDSRPPERIR